MYTSLSTAYTPCVRFTVPSIVPPILDRCIDAQLSSLYVSCRSPYPEYIRVKWTRSYREVSPPQRRGGGLVTSPDISRSTPYYSVPSSYILSLVYSRPGNLCVSRLFFSPSSRIKVIPTEPS